MGTAAVFAIASKEPGQIHAKIVGMTSDGSLENLKWIKDRLNSLAHRHRCMTKFKKQDPETLNKLCNLLVEESDGWLFRDQVKNAQFVSRSSVYNTKTGTLVIQDELFGEVLQTVRAPQW